jgi:hypothetical protein
MQRKFFQIDCLGETLIEAHDTGGTWNGWNSPLFSYEQGQALVSEWQQRSWEARYDEAEDAFIFSVNQDFDTGYSEEFETFPAVQHGGRRFYAIGSGSWVWDEVETPDAPAPESQLRP